MRGVIYPCVIAALAGVGLTSPADAQAPSPTLLYITSGNCLNSPLGFNSNLEPVYAGTAWTSTFTAEGGTDAHGVVTEIGQLLDGASLGVGPRMHGASGNSYKVTFSPTVTSNPDGTSTVAVGALSGTFTGGPYAGKSFTASPGLVFKRWPPQNRVSIEASVGQPVIQTLSLSDGTKFQRICTATGVVTSPLP
jgi:hypothetical protein